MPQARTRATLYIFSGLPGVGKSALAQRLASRLGAVYLRIDSVEQALRDLCAVPVGGEGYRLCYRVARDNLLIGSDVVADSCNPIALTRAEWRAVAAQCGARAIDIQVVCSDRDEHRRRVETRLAEIPGLKLPGWNETVGREYHAWSEAPITVDTARKSVDSCLAELLAAIASATTTAETNPGRPSVSKHKLKGACHCGNTRVDVELARAPETYSPRACDCDFCRQHGAAYLSDPEGALRISVGDGQLLGKYRQGSASADCLFCRRCGVLIGVAYEHAGRIFATINSRLVEGATRLGEPIAVSPKSLSATEKADRWQELWFADVKITCAQD